MKGRWTDPVARVRFVVAMILIIGWVIAGVAYVTAPPVAENDDVYELEHSKRYTRDLERIGGKADVLANDLNEWLASTWEGKTRAYTIAVLTVLAAGAYVLVTRAGSPPSA